MGFIGKQPTPVPLTSSDIGTNVINNTHIGDTAISGFDALTSAPADTDEFLISDGGVLKRIDASLVGGGLDNWSENSGNLLPSNASYGIYLGVNSATASNLLDDYEEGTWTPTVKGDASTASASTQVGNYVKIGAYVWASFYFVGTFPSSSNGSTIGIAGLPFSIISGTNNYFGCSIGHVQAIDYSSSFDFATLRAKGDDDRVKYIRNRRGNIDGFPESLVSGDSLNLSGTLFYKTA